MIEGGERKVYYYFHNHQGSVIAVVDGEGNIVNVYDYWADGNLRYIEEEVEQPFLYTGAYFDRETNLYYLRARYYSPELRRFIQRDPILFEGGINLYSYTGCDFVNWGDWEGLHGAIGVAIGGILVSYGSGFIICTLKCFDVVDKVCNDDSCKISTYDPFSKSIICLKLKFKVCLPLCRPILQQADCIANKEICSIDNIRRIIDDILDKGRE